MNQRDDGRPQKRVFKGTKEVSRFNLDVHLDPALPLQRGLDLVGSIEKVAR